MANKKFTDLTTIKNINDDDVFAVSASTDNGTESVQVAAKQVSNYVQNTLKFVTIQETNNFSDKTQVNVQIGNYVFSAYKQNANEPNITLPKAALVIVPFMQSVYTYHNKTYEVTLCSQNFNLDDNLTVVAVKNTEYFNFINIKKINDNVAILSASVNKTITDSDAVPLPVIVTNPSNGIKCNVSFMLTCLPNTFNFNYTKIDNSTGIIKIEPRIARSTYSICVSDLDVTVTDLNDKIIDCKIIKATDIYNQSVTVKINSYYPTITPVYICLKEPYNGTLIAKVVDKLSGLSNQTSFTVNFKG